MANTTTSQAPISIGCPHHRVWTQEPRLGEAENPVPESNSFIAPDFDDENRSIWGEEPFDDDTLQLGVCEQPPSENESFECGSVALHASAESAKDTDGSQPPVDGVADKVAWHERRIMHEWLANHAHVEFVAVGVTKVTSKSKVLGFKEDCLFQDRRQRTRLLPRFRRDGNHGVPSRAPAPHVISATSYAAARLVGSQRRTKQIAQHRCPAVSE